MKIEQNYATFLMDQIIFPWNIARFFLLLLSYRIVCWYIVVSYELGDIGIHSFIFSSKLIVI